VGNAWDGLDSLRVVKRLRVGAADCGARDQPFGRGGVVDRPGDPQPRRHESDVEDEPKDVDDEVHH
jgi:hypothetical protein